MFMLDQKGKTRPIFDGREINKFIDVPNCKYDTLRDVSLMYEDHMSSVAFDL